MRRRDAVLAPLAATTLPMRVGAQPVPKVFRIGVLTRFVPRDRFLLPGALLEIGYEEGRHFVLDYRFAQGQDDRLASLAAELVAARVDLIVAFSNLDILAAKRATSTIPIVMAAAAAPVEFGLVASLARPGGNVTGTTYHDPELSGKLLSVLREAIPSVVKVTALGEPEAQGEQVYRRAFEQAAHAVRIRLTLLSAKTLAEIETAFAAVNRKRPDALFISPSGQIYLHRARVIDFAARQRLPAIYLNKSLVADGGLMSYSADYGAVVRRTAAIVDRILKGAKPADIPVEQPIKYELAINLKTARALGLTIPQSLLLRADLVVQ